MHKYPAVSEIARALSIEQETEQLLRVVMDAARMALDAERATLYLVDRERGLLWSKIAHGLEIAEIRMPVAQGIAGHVAQTGETVNISDAYQDPRFHEEIDRQTGFRTESVLCMPLRDSNHAVIGVMQVLNKREGPFAPRDEDALRSLCAAAAPLVTALLLNPPYRGRS